MYNVVYGNAQGKELEIMWILSLKESLNILCHDPYCRLVDYYRERIKAESVPKMFSYKNKMQTNMFNILLCKTQTKKEKKSLR